MQLAVVILQFRKGSLSPQSNHQLLWLGTPPCIHVIQAQLQGIVSRL